MPIATSHAGAFFQVGLKARRTHAIAGAVAGVHVAGVADAICDVVDAGRGG